jgi:hypothetical protein
MEQLCTIGICGLLGGVAIMLYLQGILRFILADYLHIYIFWSGVALLALVALRAFGLWLSVGTKTANHDHAHEHCHDHGHTHDHSHGDGHHEEEDHGHALAADHASHATEHVHDCEQNHAQANSLGHTHDCGHEHSWNPGRYIVLLLPIALYFLHLPNAGFSAAGISINANDLDEAASGKYVENAGLQVTKESANDPIQVVSVVAGGPAAKAGVKARDLIMEISREEDVQGKTLAQPDATLLKALALEDAVQKLKGKPGNKVKLTIAHSENPKPEVIELTYAEDVIPVEFNTLQGAAYTPSLRQYYAGRKVQLVGQYAPGNNDRTFTLVRFKITCCAADARPLNVMIMLDPQAPGNLSHLKALEWVKVAGRISFGKRKDRDEYVTVLTVASPQDVESTDPDPRPYIQ